MEIGRAEMEWGAGMKGEGGRGIIRRRKVVLGENGEKT